MSANAPELKGYSEREAQLQAAVDHCARLMLKADRGTLGLPELDELLLAEIDMRNKSRALGLKKHQLQLMLEKSVARLRDEQAAVPLRPIGR